jgi:hypothetical protein
MMANNVFPYRFLGVLRGDCTAKPRDAASLRAAAEASRASLRDGNL